MADYTVTPGDGLADATASAIGDVNSFLDEELRSAIADAGEASASYLNANAPRDTGAFARSWKHREHEDLGHYTSEVYSPRRSLTHLLTDGHEIYNQHGGPYGHVGPAKPVGFADEARRRGIEALERGLGVS